MQFLSRAAIPLMLMSPPDPRPTSWAWTIMADIFHNFPIKATLQQGFRAVSTPTGLDSWCTKRSSGEPTLGADYDLWFGPDYDWRAVVSPEVITYVRRLTRAMLR